MWLVGLLGGCVVAVEQSIVFRDPIHHIEVHLAAGDVAVAAGPADGPVVLEGNVAGPSGDTDVARVADGVLTIALDCPACGGSIDLTAPPAVSLALTTEAGSITVRGMDGPVEADAVLGAVEVAGHGAGSVALGVRLGDLRLVREAPGDVVIDVETGDATVTVPAGPWDLDLSVTRGRQQVDPAVTSDPSGPRLAARVTAGDLAIRAAP